MKGNSTKITAPLLGAHFVQNVLAAVSVGLALDMTTAQITQGAAKIKPFPRTMEPRIGAGGSLVVDDSYNASFNGFLAALDWLANVSATRKFVVTQGVIELGSESDKVHKELGNRLGEIVDQIFLTSSEFVGPLSEGLGKQRDKLKTIGTLRELIPTLNHNDIVLIEGKVPENVRKVLL
mgnify:FL=1